MRTRNYKDGAVGLSLLTSANGKEVMQENKGNQRCRWENCSTILNRYNPNRYCHAHAFKGSILDSELRDEEIKRIAKRSAVSWADRMKKAERKRLSQKTHND